MSAALAPARMHPAQRRRMSALLPPQPAHEIELRPLGGGGPETLIVDAREDAFLPAIFADLQAEDWRERLAARRAIRRGADGVPELGLPIHRHFHVVLLEAVCRVPGFPPVAPTQFDGMGLVLRRVQGDGALSGWLRSDEQPLGWRRIAPSLALDEPDPDPLRRAGAPMVAAQLAAALAARRNVARPAQEQVFPLFVAPVEVCAARQRTIVFGLVPVASSEQAATAEVPDFTQLDDANEAAEVVKHLSEFLKARPSLALPRAGQRLDAGWRVLQTRGVEGPLHAFGVFLHQLLVELGAFGAEPAAQALRAELAQLQLPLPPDALGQPRAPLDAAAFLEGAARVLVAGEDNDTDLVMPLAWPLIDAAAGARLTQRALACLTARYREVVAQAPKFEREDTRYVVRAFVRVRGHGHCPSRLVWSRGYSEPFRIRPWWDADGPATRISLPSLAQLKKVKPTISFEMPPVLSNLLRGDMKALSDGEGSKPSGLGIGFICSFSLPVITFCAFIVLNIFLSLFDILFSWMAYLKICLPYPKPKST